MTIRIVVDEREKNSRVCYYVSKLGSISTFGRLPVGDYVVTTETAIERKTVNDLINSVYDGRLFIQCSNLATHYSKPFIIIEGNLINMDKRGRIDHQSNLIVDKIRLAYDTFIKIALDFHIPILYTPSIYYTAELLILLASNPL